MSVSQIKLELNCFISVDLVITFYKRATLLVNTISICMYYDLNSSTTKKQTTKIFVCKFSKKFKSKLYHIENSKTRGANSVDLDEVAHYEPPHQDLRCLQIQLFSSLVVRVDPGKYGQSYKYGQRATNAHT